MRVAGILLAAGFSRRLGRPKQAVEIGGEMLLGRAVRVAAEADLHPLIVVVQPEASWLTPSIAAGCEVVRNDEAEEGIAASIRRGLLALGGRPEIAGAVLLTCDQVLLTVAHLRALCAELDRSAASAYAGKRAVPAYFPCAMFPDLLSLRGDTGARGLLRDARAIPAEFLALDIDTEEDVTRATALFSADVTRDLP